MRRIFHIDMDAFFAAIETRRRPELKGKPVIVGGHGDPRQRGVVSTASYEARKYGVRSGMPLRTAFRRCPQAVFLPVDYTTYARVSERFKSILKNFSPIMEDVGIDEAFLDMSQAPGSSEEVADAIKRRIKEEIGLTCSIGIATNKLLAKMASDLQKPDGRTILREADVPRRIWPLPVRKLWGVGPKTEQALAKLGVARIGELAQLPEETLIARLGQAHGHYLHEAARGIDQSPLITHWEPKTLSRETTFQQDVADWASLQRTLLQLCKELVARMHQEGYAGRNVTVKLRYEDFDTHSHSLTLPSATDDPETIREAATRCLRHFPLLKKVRLVGIRIGHLVHSTRASAGKILAADDNSRPSRGNLNLPTRESST